MALIVLEGVELFMRGRLEGLLRGHTLVGARAAAGKPAGAGAGESPALVIADISRVDPAAVVAAHPGVPVLGFGNHTDTQGLRRAHEAGFAQVVVKSALVERAEVLVGRLLGPVE